MEILKNTLVISISYRDNYFVKKWYRDSFDAATLLTWKINERANN